MRRALLPVWLVAAAVAVCGSERHDPDVIVFIHGMGESPGVMATAEGLATRMLASAGVSVSWRRGSPNYDGPAEVIEALLTNQPDENVKPGALAWATLGLDSGTRIEVYCNRARAGMREGSPPVLAHVLVHEITHILEGVDRHSQTGIMKAHWDVDDWRRLRCKPLPFDEEDLRLLEAWAGRHKLAAYRTLLTGVK